MLAVLKDRGARLDVTLEEASRSLEGDVGAVDELEKALRVGETRFYRDPNQWQAIEQEVVKTFPTRATLNVLCAGCSTGEEAYTIAMLLRTSRRSFHVLGVDRSASAISTARKAVYGPDAIRDIPAVYLTRYCDSTEGVLRVRGVITEFVSFKQCDLVKSIPTGPFHLIFFKNVLLYLAQPIGEEVASRLVAELDDGGFLFPAASEVLRLKNAGLTSVRPSPNVTAFRKGT